MLDVGNADTQEVSEVCADRYEKKDIRSRQFKGRATVNIDIWKGSIREIKYK